MTSWPRAALAGAAALAIALFAGAQAASSALAHERPELAERLFPFAAEAMEERAQTRFFGGDSANAIRAARAARAIDPLARDALGILAQTMPGDVEPEAVMAAAARISKRGTLLQGTLLEYHTVRGDLPATIRTIDRVLAVYPRLTSQIMPIYVDALTREGAVPLFAEMLRNDPAWENAFFSAASRRTDLLGPLIALRLELGADAEVEEDVDTQLMGALIDAGRLSDARAIYALAAGDAARPARTRDGGLTLDWRTELPPFDWTLQDDPGEYARVIRRDDALELSFRRGRGGEVARRLLIPPRPIGAITVTHDFADSGAAENIRLTLECDGVDRELIDRPLGPSPTRLAVPAGAACARYAIALGGRAWSTGNSVEGKIEGIVLSLR